jgi:hypothetical protein
MNISVTEMIMIQNYFSNTVLNILYNETRRINFQRYNQGGGGRELERKLCHRVYAYCPDPQM